MGSRKSPSESADAILNEITKLIQQTKGSNEMAAEIGNRFPDFSLQNQDGKNVTLDDYAGKWLVLYVYPKDDTPGCTIQGRSFTASKAQFDDAGIQVVGLSQDDVTS